MIGRLVSLVALSVALSPTFPIGFIDSRKELTEAGYLVDRERALE